jgi:Xaa-Pro aminopeptidase
MKKICLLLLSVFMLFSVSPAAGQSSQDDIDASNRQFEQWAINLSEFVKDVRFIEEDVQSLISLWDDFNAIGDQEPDDDEGEYVDFNSILNDASFRSWANSKGLSGETWLKKTMRIMAMIMRSSIEANSAEGQFNIKAQLEQLEEMKAQMDEEAYQQMKQAMEAGAAAMQGLNDSYKHLPVPSDSEKALLAKYNEQLMNLE